MNRRCELGPKCVLRSVGIPCRGGRAKAGIETFPKPPPPYNGPDSTPTRSEGGRHDG
jgi:hypothetical protein